MALAVPRRFRERDGDDLSIPISPNWTRENFQRGEGMSVASRAILRE